MSEHEHSIVDERAFSESIDCRFPYSDSAESRRLIDAAMAISPNAVYQVIFELACPPESQRVATKDQRGKLLSLVGERFQHPLSNMILSIARRLVDGETMSISECLANMNAVRPYPAQYNALNIAYSSLTGDPDSLLDQEYERIVNSWSIGMTGAERQV